jgi:hypothetical protein
LKETNQPTHLLWRDKRFPRSTALSLSIYASLLPILALRAATRTKYEPTHKYKLCLDALPIDSTQGMALMKAMSKESDIDSMWRSNIKLESLFKIG